MNFAYFILSVSVLVICTSASMLFISVAMDNMAVTRIRKLENKPLVNEYNYDTESSTSLEDEYIEALQAQPFYRDMDARIEKMKMDMADKNIQSYEETLADELHPLVKNIPHTDVNEEREARKKYGDEVAD